MSKVLRAIAILVLMTIAFVGGVQYVRYNMVIDVCLDDGVEAYVTLGSRCDRYDCGVFHK